METVWWLVNWQRVLNAIECKFSIFDPVCHPADDAAKIRCCTFLHKQIQHAQILTRHPQIGLKILLIIHLQRNQTHLKSINEQIPTSTKIPKVFSVRVMCKSNSPDRVQACQIQEQHQPISLQKIQKKLSNQTLPTQVHTEELKKWGFRTIYPINYHLCLAPRGK